jgi:hypothetical protein
MHFGYVRRSVRAMSAAGLLGTLTVAAATGLQAAAPCNEGDTVGGGTLGISAGSTGTASGLGWDVGSGQCNGSFTTTSDSGFPSPDGDGIELAMRAEQRRVGQVANGGGDYEVETGADQPMRAWWNFQHSIAYDGDIGDLDALVFAIRTDAGSAVAAAPADLLFLRPAIDDRNDQPNPTTTYSDLYQTSQNPLFGWLTDGASGPYDLDEEGAWTLTLAASEAGQLASVSICIHTLNAACAAPPAVYSCSGKEIGRFDPPAGDSISLKKPGRVIPLKVTCADADGNPLSSGDIAAPVVTVSQVPGGALPGPFGSAGRGTPPDQFAASGSRWQFNLDTGTLPGPGTYQISIDAGGDDLLLAAPVATLVID